MGGGCRAPESKAWFQIVYYVSHAGHAWSKIRIEEGGGTKGVQRDAPAAPPPPRSSLTPDALQDPPPLPCSPPLTAPSSNPDANAVTPALPSRLSSFCC